MVILTDLQPETNYQITVSAYTIKGDGASSVPIFAKTSAKLPDPPHVFKRPSSSSEVIIRWRTSARDVVSYKLRYGKSLQRLRARDQAKLKMKDMTFLPRTNTHEFRGLGELSIVFFDLNIFLSFSFVLIPHETALSFLFLRSLAPLLIDDFILSFIRSICLSFLSFIRWFVRSGLNSFFGSFLISFILSFVRCFFFFVRLFVHTFVRSFVHVFIHFFILTFFPLFVRPFMRSFVYAFIRPFVHSFVCSFVHTFIHSFIRSLFSLFVRSLFRSFVRSFLCLFASFFHPFFLPSSLPLFVHSFFFRSWIQPLLLPSLTNPYLSPDPGVWYLFKVSVKTNAGWSPETPLWAEIPPGPPTGPPLEVRASAQSSTRIRVTWKEPDEWKRNGPLAGYSVVYNPLNRRGQALVKNVTNPNQTRVILTDLRMFTEYEIRVRALGQEGPGPLSRPVMVKTNQGGRSLISS